MDAALDRLKKVEPRVLGEHLRSWLRTDEQNDCGTVLTRRLVRRLAPTFEDAFGWELDEYLAMAPRSFERRKVHPFGLLGLVAKVPGSALVNGIRRAASSDSPAIRRALVEVVRFAPLGERLDLFRLFGNERHPTFARRVQSLLDSELARSERESPITD